MGANEFRIELKGKTAAKAFCATVKKEEREYRRSRYTLTLAEKSGFRMVTPLAGETSSQCIDRCIDDPRHFSNNECGPAGCIDVGPGTEPATRVFVFFGWASS